MHLLNLVETLFFPLILIEMIKPLCSCGAYFDCTAKRTIFKHQARYNLQQCN